MIDADALRGLMESLSRDVSHVLGKPVGISFNPAENQEDDWSYLPSGDYAEFVIRARNSTDKGQATHKKSGHSVDVIQLIELEHETETFCWCAFRFLWISRGMRGTKTSKLRVANFDFYEASWTFQIGSPYSGKEQVLRAEWANVEFGRSGDAGQPHWHIDKRYILPDSFQYEFASLVSGDAHELRGVELGDVHLPMAGWGSATKITQHPGCWQHGVGTHYEQLKLWMQLVPLVAKRELEKIKLRPSIYR